MIFFVVGPKSKLFLITVEQYESFQLIVRPVHYLMTGITCHYKVVVIKLTSLLLDMLLIRRFRLTLLQVKASSIFKHKL